MAKETAAERNLRFATEARAELDAAEREVLGLK